METDISQVLFSTDNESLVAIFMKKMDMKWPPFRKGKFLCSSVTKKMFYPEPWNLSDNFPMDSFFRHISHCVTNISYVVFKILDVREGYPYPQIGSFFYEENDLKWQAFRTRTFQGSSIARQIYRLHSWNLVENCPIASSYRNRYHCLTIISYIVSRILNVREGYLHPTIPNFDHCTDGIWWPWSPPQLLHHSKWTLIECKT